MNINDLRMSLKTALDNMWARIDTRIHTIEEGEGTPSLQADVGLYIDAQGYLCQRIGSDT